MKITLMYNPEAGGSQVPVENLVRGLERRGAEVFAQNTKEEEYEESLGKACDFIIIAGGDGTIEKIAKKIIHQQVPVVLLPYGNANNIAESLEVDTALDSIVKSWEEKNFRALSIGSVEIRDESFKFLESVGWGLFAQVLVEIKASKSKGETTSDDKVDKVQYGLEKLSEAVRDIQPSYYQILLDGVDYSGFYLWVEVMNTQSVGPLLQLAPQARHGDEYLDVVLIRDGERRKLEYFLTVQKGENPTNEFSPIQAKKIKIRSNQPLHIDDEILQLEDSSDPWAEVELIPRYFRVLNA
ncbi:MAG TPA: diacylglycerol kinase family protein [Cyclobacteriaceae bacterium]|nr:diacylglycerol kinase family protein [Cyclobacteriaceae bacterium]